MERDSRDRFLPGNQVARGNRGNRKPKWGNKNAVKTGEYERICFVNRNGQLVVQKPDQPLLIIPQENFIVEGDRVKVRISIEALASKVLSLCR